MPSDFMLTTFPDPDEVQKALTVLENMGEEYELVIPSPILSLVALPALVMSREVRGRLETLAPTIVFSGWVDYRAPSAAMPDGSPPEGKGACFRRAAIMVLGPCMADETKIRIIAHLEGDLGPLLPYLNAVIPQASYAPTAQTLTFMEGYRMIALYRDRITIAKADEIMDAWLTLDSIRRLVEQIWSNRERIAPSYEIRRRPPAIEIFKRLPRTNCQQCGEPSCLAFAVRVWSGEIPANRCLPVFTEGGSNPQLREALLEICSGMGIGTGETPRAVPDRLSRRS